MLSREERAEIEEELALYEQKQAACVEALKIVQKRRGWVSDEHLREVAQMLEMSAEALDGVATFYNLIFRRPVGRHVILLCDSVSCWVMGCDRVRERLQSRLKVEMGQAGEDRPFTLLPMACLGACDRAPVLMVDETLYGDVSEQKVDEILKEYRE